MTARVDRACPLDRQSRRHSVGVVAVLALLATLSGIVWPGAALATWESSATQPFSANGANGVGIDESDGSVWIVSAFDNAIRKYTSRGELLFSVGGFGTTPGLFNLPSALAIGPGGDVYVTDVGNRRVQRFTAAGAYVRSYGSSSILSNPRGVDVDSSGNVYVADIATGLHRFAPTGALTTTYSTSVAAQAFAVAVGPDGGVWVSDFATSPDVVRKIDPVTGSVLRVLSGFGQPTDIEVDADGRVYVLDFNSATVRTYTAAGAFVEATQPVSSALALALDQYGRLFVSGGSQATTLNPAPVEVVRYVGATGDLSVEPAFAAATSAQGKRSIDFDGDGFDDLAAHTFRPIPDTHYIGLGVTLLGLDARSVGTQPWTHSPPIGAWQTGFSQPARPYSFVFTDPVASFGLFASDVEADIAATVHLDDGRREFFTLPRGSNASTRFYGFGASGNEITRVDLDSFDYHIIDDVQFGRVDGSPPSVTITTPADGGSYPQGSTVVASYGCTDDVGVVACLGSAGVVDGQAIDTSTAGLFNFSVTGTDASGKSTTVNHSYSVVDTTAPTVTITSPNVDTYDLGESVLADYTCSDNVAVATCAGDVLAGTPIDTSMPGPSIFTVVATDTVGLTATSTVEYGVSTTIDPTLGLDGSITANPGNHPVTVVDAPDPADGVVITVGGTGPDRVTFSVCGGGGGGFLVRLAPGSEVTLTCGSVIAEVAAGSAEVVTPDGNTTMVVPIGGEARLDETGAVENQGTAPITVTAGTITQTVEPGTSVAWRTEGFFRPVDMGGVWNVTKGGSNVPLKFRIFYGSTELTDPGAIVVNVTARACTGGSDDALEVVDAPGATQLLYDGDQFHLSWKTPKRPGTCFEVAVSTGSATPMRALFKLR